MQIVNCYCYCCFDNTDNHNVCFNIFDSYYGFSLKGCESVCLSKSSFVDQVLY